MKYTREQILALPAGVELDVIAAEVVMGWPRVASYRHWHSSRDLNHVAELRERVKAAGRHKQFYFELAQLTEHGDCAVTYYFNLIHADAVTQTKACIMAMMEISE